MTNTQPPDETENKSRMLTDTRRQLRHQRVQKVVKYFGIGSGGVGILGIGWLSFLGQPIAAFVAPVLVSFVGTFLAIAYKFISGVTNRVWDKIEEELDTLEEPFANWIVQHIKTSVIGLWWKLTSKFEQNYYRSLIDDLRELEIDGFKGLPILDLEDVFVPLRVITESPDKISGAMIQTCNDSGSQEIWSFIGQSTNKKYPAFRRLAIVGAPGSGKTTLLKHLALIYAKKQNRNHQSPKHFIPVLLYLRHIRELIVDQYSPTLPELIASHVKKLPSTPPLNPPPNWIENQLKFGNCLVMLDGLDEVADASQRLLVSAWVNQQMTDYTQTPFILTSRPDGYNSAPVKMVKTVLRVLPFTHEQVKKFILSWYPQTAIMRRAGRDTPAVRNKAKKSAEDLIDRIIDNRAIADMATNPLLVTMIATVHYKGSALPGRRVELYQKICDVLLESRQVAKENINTSLTGEQNKHVLQVLALSLMNTNIREFRILEGASFIQQDLLKVAQNTLTPETFLKQIAKICGLLVERELGVYEFAHLSFQEYLAAAQIKELQQGDILTEKMDDPWWKETIRLYAAQGDATKLLQKAIANKNVNYLTLALDCLQESLKVEPEVKEELLRLLEDGLEDNDPIIAKLAADVSLLRRLDNLFKGDSSFEIDLGYVNCAEYQLFLSEESPLQDLTLRRAKAPITGIDFEIALQFCTWLNLKASLLQQSNDGYAFYYRLPTVTEIQTYPAREYKDLGCCLIGGSSSQKQGLRIVRAKLPPRYIQLGKYLAAQEWEKADRETVKALPNLEAIEQLSPEDLRTIDLLWLYYSQGRFSLGAQVSILERIGGKPLAGYFPYLWHSNSAENSRNLFDTLARKYIHNNLERLSFERSLLDAELEVVMVNVQGQETQRQIYQAKYFSEDLAKDLALDMMLIPTGSFVMGSPKTEKDSTDDERPKHQVNVSAFLIGKYQVTQAQWRVVAAMSKVKRDLDPAPSHFKGDNLPVEQVSWLEAVEFCQRLSRHTGREYRLPSEAEWEYACRAGTDTPFHFGETIAPELVNYDGDNPYSNAPKGEFRQKTTPVVTFRPNAYGLCDMHGNVWEWCADDWHGNYRGAPTDGSAWLGGSVDDDDLSSRSNLVEKTQNMLKTIISFVTRRKTNSSTKLLRGGSWFGSAQHCRSAIRNHGDAHERYYHLGFRVVGGLR